MMNHDFFDMYMNDDMLAHLDETEIRQPMQQLMEILELEQTLHGKVQRRLAKLVEHMNHCGSCLSKQIADGQLIPLEDYWAAGPSMGAGRLPKLHRMMN